ncbi:hypothetical protein BSL78_03285 [Apostichopus japonicus]|uniref:Uncharacterized protein n=1 Tax=Stichopus japonicus TaxID=307972 RepID=A0A2G8LI22_STIJA|nr:hypothetical protein BSL78_03285 [Apostichopus japonicus]
MGGYCSTHPIKAVDALQLIDSLDGPPNPVHRDDDIHHQNFATYIECSELTSVPAEKPSTNNCNNLNVNGMRDHRKRIFQYCISMEVDCVCLQETHILEASREGESGGILPSPTPGSPPPPVVADPNPVPPLPPPHREADTGYQPASPINSSSSVPRPAPVSPDPEALSDGDSGDSLIIVSGGSV